MRASATPKRERPTTRVGTRPSICWRKHWKHSSEGSEEDRDGEPNARVCNASNPANIYGAARKSLSGVDGTRGAGPLDVSRRTDARSEVSRAQRANGGTVPN